MYLMVLEYKSLKPFPIQNDFGMIWGRARQLGTREKFVGCASNLRAQDICGAHEIFGECMSNLGVCEKSRGA
jgi:hypothetical protein